MMPGRVARGRKKPLLMSHSVMQAGRYNRSLHKVCMTAASKQLQYSAVMTMKPNRYRAAAACLHRRTY
jgi:hypothetical protein